MSYNRPTHIASPGSNSATCRVLAVQQGANGCSTDARHQPEPPIAGASLRLHPANDSAAGQRLFVNNKVYDPIFRMRHASWLTGKS
ncbi:hypothetical protein IG631_17476 [Alternaria alternata]|nr:hypothetical protein IG631_17476 [Alternaria alternata]